MKEEGGGRMEDGGGRRKEEEEQEEEEEEGIPVKHGALHIFFLTPCLPDPMPWWYPYAVLLLPPGIPMGRPLVFLRVAP